MADNVHEDLARIVSREMKAANTTEDIGRMAVLLTALTDQLGKVIALSSRGDPIAIDTLLTGTEAALGEIAAETAAAYHRFNSARGGEA